MGRRGDELVFRSAQLGASLIHRLGNAVWSVAGQVFFKSVAKKATAGSFRFASQALGPFEDVFRNRDSSFHTRSITARQAGDTPAKAVSEAQRLGLPFHNDEGQSTAERQHDFPEISRSFIGEQREGMAVAFDRVCAGEGF